MAQEVRLSIEGPLARITLDRPEALNSLNPDLRWELSQHFDEVEKNDERKNKAFKTGFA